MWHMSPFTWRPEKGIRAADSVVIGSYELSETGVRNKAWVVCKSSQCF